MSKMNAYLHCLYAEDIRTEVAGTYSIIGVFQGGGIQVQSFPAALAKLAISVTLAVPKDIRPSALRIEVLCDNNVLQSIIAPKELIEGAFEQSQNDPEARGLMMNFIVNFVNFKVEQPCKIRAAAYINDLDALIGNGLVIKQLDTA